MADSRPRNRRPRNRGGKNRMSDQAATRRHHQHISALQQALQPQADALASAPDASMDDVVERIRAQATALAKERVEGDVSTVVAATLDEIFGLGPLEQALSHPDGRSIRIEGAQVFVNDERLPRGFRDAMHARSVVDRILGSVGKKLADQPDGVRADMMDGSTVRARLEGSVLHVDIERPAPEA